MVTPRNDFAKGIVEREQRDTAGEEQRRDTYSMTDDSAGGGAHRKRQHDKTES